MLLPLHTGQFNLLEVPKGNLFHFDDVYTLNSKTINNYTKKFELD